MHLCIISNVSRFKFYIREQLYKQSLAIYFSSLPCSGQTAYLYNFRHITSHIVDKPWCLYCSKVTMISNMNVALNKFSVKLLFMSICQNLNNMSVKRCAFYLY